MYVKLVYLKIVVILIAILSAEKIEETLPEVFTLYVLDRNKKKWY